MNKQHNEQITIDLDEVTLRFRDMEPIVLPRSSVGNKLRLLDWVYQLTGWPGMNARRLRAFISAVFQHHGWALPEANESPLVTHFQPQR